MLTCILLYTNLVFSVNFNEVELLLVKLETSQDISNRTPVKNDIHCVIILLMTPSKEKHISNLNR